MGVRKGKLGEYVFLKNCSYSNDKLSYLDWQFTNPYIALKTDVGYKRFNIENAVSYGFCAKSSTMSDSDWLNVQFSDLSASQYKTNYSESDNVTKRDISVSTEATFSFFPMETLSLKPLIAADFEYMRFVAQDGEYSYAKNNGNFYYRYDDVSHNSTGNFSGDVLYYRRWSFYLWLGIAAEYRVVDFLNIGASVAISPYYFATDIDTHCLTNTRYIDIIEDNFAAYKASIALSVPLAKNSRKSAIGLDMSYLYTSVSRGKVYSAKINTASAKYVEDTSSECGMDEQFFTISLFYKFFLF